MVNITTLVIAGAVAYFAFKSFSSQPSISTPISDPSLVTFQQLSQTQQQVNDLQVSGFYFSDGAKEKLAQMGIVV